MELKDLKARVILNSRGEKTIEIVVNRFGIGSAPSGASKGKHEVVYYPENSVEKAIEVFNYDLTPRLKGIEISSFEDLEKIEGIIFEEYGIENVGGNTVIALESAILHALSLRYEIPVWKVIDEKAKGKPLPLSNVIGGGIHARWRGTDIQEFLVIQTDAKSIKEAIFTNARIHKILESFLSEKDLGFLGAKNDEGAWVTTLKNLETLELLNEVVDLYNQEHGTEVRIGLDIAASGLYDNGYYIYRRDNKKYDREEQINFIKNLSEVYNLFYIEDPLYEEDFDGFTEITSSVDSMIVGDDLTVTNPERLEKAIRNNSIKGIIVKPNQIGSLLKVRDVIKRAKENGITPIMSHRSGETTDDLIAHLAIAFECPIIKIGINGGERTAKLRVLIESEEEF